jgi:hypothetical protein
MRISMGSSRSKNMDIATKLEEDPGKIDNLTQSVMYRQGTYMTSNNKSGKYSATVVVTPNYVLFTLKLPQYILPATVYGKTSDLLNPNHRWVLNSETLGSACGQYKVDRVVYFKGNRLVFSSTQKGIRMGFGKTFMSNTNLVLNKV